MFYLKLLLWRRVVSQFIGDSGKPVLYLREKSRMLIIWHVLHPDYGYVLRLGSSAQTRLFATIQQLS